MQFDFFTITILFTSLQGFLLALTILIKSGRKNFANVYLGLFVLCISFAMVGRLSMYYEDPNTIKVLWLLMDSVLFLYGPLSYFYLKQLLVRDFQFDKRHLIHYIPFLLHLIFYFIDIFVPQKDKGPLFNEYLFLTFYIVEAIAIILIASYHFVGFMIVQSFEKEVNVQLSFKPHLRFIKIFQIFVSVVVILWLVGYLSRLIPDFRAITVFGYETMWFVLSLITFIFAYFGLFNSEILALNIKPVKYEGSYQPDSFYEDLKLKLEKLMNEDEPFLNPKLTLAELSKSLSCNSRDLSRVINERYKMNFYEYVNHYRVERFKELARERENENLTILAIALEAGFNSKATFNSVFKKITNTTPREYLSFSNN